MRALVHRLVPDSVVGRTALVLVGALLLSLAASLAVFAIQRSEALTLLGTRDAAERIAAVARLLEDAPPEGRRAILRTVETPGFRFGWGTTPLVATDSADPEGGAASLAEHLRKHLSGHQVLVTGKPHLGPGPSHGFNGLPQPKGAPDIEPPHGPPGEPPHGPSNYGFGPALRISVQLFDGSWLNVVAPLDPPEPLWRPRFLVPVVFSLLVVALAALAAVRRAVGPFATFAAAAERLGVDVSSPALTEDGPREVRRAAQAFNIMQGRVRRLVEDRTQMLAAISHDLRTPITRLRLRAEFVDDDVQRDKMLSDLDEMERMIASTLAFARDDAAREIRRPTDIAALVQGLVEDLVATGIEASYAGPESLVMRARPMGLKRAVANLLDNAGKYGKRARVRLEARPGDVLVVIDDDGPGIAEGDREMVFAPFVRLETSRSRDTGGTGLGLSIARAGIRAHGGDIQLANRPEGGLRVTVELPSG